MKSSVGICIGASTITFVRLNRKSSGITEIGDVLSVTHNGSPEDLFRESFFGFNHDTLPAAVTGRKFRSIINLTTISEPEAAELAFGFIENRYVSGNGNERISAVASLGAETFIVYTLDDQHKISSLIAKNQCASGTGEFFLQQIKRMDIGLDEVLLTAKDAVPYKVSGRCSVFCKSDCTHALNKGKPKGEVASGLALMMAEKIEELLESVPEGKVLLTGGVTKNYLVMDFLKRKRASLEIPEEAAYFEALGAAVYAMNNNVNPLKSPSDLFVKRESSFVFHPPLADFKDKVRFCEMEKGTAEDGDKCIVGLDVGSTTTKAVLLRAADNKIVGQVYLYTLGNPIKAARECYSELLRQVPRKIKVIGIGTTGSGRHIAGLHALTTEIINEIIAHASAAIYFDPEVDTIYEIGGQDAKYTFIVNKVPADYAMNEACSAGTGSFIEEAAFESLGVKVTDIEAMAMKGNHPPNFSDQCSTFISSDIKTALHENISRENVVAGIVYSICLNYVNRVKGTRQAGEKIFMQGGVCYNKAVPIAMAALTGSEIIVPPEPGLMGAFGVALEVKNKIGLGLTDEKEYSLKELAERDVVYKDPFICRGGKEKCDRKCEINLIGVMGKNYPFGGACNKYYNLVYNKTVDSDNFDFIRIRNDLLFNKYAPAATLPDNALSVGINRSFHTHTIYPLYYNFFTSLGIKVVLPDEVEEDAKQRELTSFCFPCQLSIGLFQNLLKKSTDFYFVPQVLEMYVEDADYHRLDFNSSCAFVGEEPLFLRQAFKDYQLNGRYIMPVLNFANGYGSQEEKFQLIAEQLGIRDKGKVKDAYNFAVRMQNEYHKEMFSLGEEFLEMLKDNPDTIGMVLIGRPYNSYTHFANKGIPRKFASRGVYVLPFDMFDYRKETVDEDQFWEGSKKILKAAKIIKQHPQLYATYISNFSCAPDSMTIPQFRTIMGSKPSLTLELDGHTADAGINTRIDAALDIIQNYRKLKEKKISAGNFTAAKIQFSALDTYFISSEGEKIPLNDKRVVVIVPSIGDLCVEYFAAGMRSQGFNTIALPEGNNEILKYGRANATGKECLPLILIAGSLIDYIENQWDGKSYIVMLIVQGAGNCRLGQYPVFLRNLILRKKLKNVAVLPLMNEDGFAGFGPHFSLRAVQNILAADVLDDIRSGIMAHAEDPAEGLKIFREEFNRLIREEEKHPENIYKDLKVFARNIKRRIPSGKNIKDAKYIALVGEIYVRRDHFSHKYLNRRFAEKGFILKDAYITEWLFYVDYLLSLKLLEPDTSFRKKYERFVRQLFMRLAEYRIKKILAHSGYYEYSRTDIEKLLNHSRHIIPVECKGEPGLTLGVALAETIEKYCGVVNLGPFGCMPTRFSESVTVPEMKIENKIYAKKLNDPSYELPPSFNRKMNIPFLTIETDGNVYPQATEAKIETFLMQAEKTAKLMTELKK